MLDGVMVTNSHVLWFGITHLQLSTALTKFASEISISLSSEFASKFVAVEDFFPQISKKV